MGLGLVRGLAFRKATAGPRSDARAANVTANVQLRAGAAVVGAA